MKSPAIAAKDWNAALRAVGLAGAAVLAATTKPEQRAAEVAVADAQRAEAEAFDTLTASRHAYLAQALPMRPLPELPDVEITVPEGEAHEVTVDFTEHP